MTTEAVSGSTTREEALQAIAARLDLRDPNYRAVETLAIRYDEYFDAGGAEPYECVIDSATGVGKTYILAAGIEYYAAVGVRDFAVITPGRTILDKTVANFTPGHKKSLLSGMVVEPTVITADNFNTAAMRAVMDDPQEVKLFVFTVQALLKPTKTDRKAHKFQEGLGKGFYQHLSELDDLIVFADEHHAYYGEKFSEAVRGLAPRSIVGLTATPHKKTPEEQIIFRYPLSLAIAEKLVKTPVLVGRKDDRNDEATKLSDGIRLLEAKEATIVRYRAEREAQGESVPVINPVMLVIAKDIDDANRVESVLNEETFLGGKWGGKRVLVVHSKQPDEALLELDQVEEPSSKIRIIISVGMLKEGWDVKNVYVIASLRSSVSEILTEQTLGRGLRLPFGAYTGWELLDTLEVLAHEKYDELLKKANVIKEAFVDYRTRISTTINAQGETVSFVQQVPVSVNVAIAGADQRPAVGDFGALGEGSDAHGITATGQAGAVVVAEGQGTLFASGPVVGTVEGRTEQAQEEVAAVKKVLLPNPSFPKLRIPELQMTQVQNMFRLQDIIQHDEFRKLGKQLATTPVSELRRRRIDVHAQGDETQVVTTAPTVDAIKSAGAQLSWEQARNELVALVRKSSVVPARAGEGKDLAPIIDAFLDGLGGRSDEILSAFMGRAVDGIVRLIAAEKKKLQYQPQFDRVVQLHDFGPERSGRPQTTRDPTGAFKKGWGYEGFKRALYEQDWFDSSTERDMANILDDADDIQFWSRLQIGDLPILWSNEGRQYNPDFVAVAADGDHWLVEVKMDKEMSSEDVLGKREAAKRWVQYVNADEQPTATWHYLLASETDIKTAKGDWGAIKSIATV